VDVHRSVTKSKFTVAARFIGAAGATTSPTGTVSSTAGLSATHSPDTLIARSR
jgi:hypothetical protein